MATTEHPDAAAFRMALLERARRIIGSAVHNENLRVQRDVRVAQEIVDVNVSTPPWCDPDTATIRTNAAATVRAARVLQAVRSLQRAAVAAELADATTSLFRERAGDAVPLVVPPATRDAVVAQLGITMEGLVQQTVRGRQVIENIQGRVCNIVLDNQFVVDLTVGAYAEDAVATVLAAPEVRRVLDARWPPPPLTPTAAPAPSTPVAVPDAAAPSWVPPAVLGGLALGVLLASGLAVRWWWVRRVPPTESAP